MLIKFETAIDSENLIMLLDKVVTGRDQPHAAFLADITLQPQNTDVSFLINQREVERIKTLIAIESARALVRGQHQAIGISPCLADKLDRDFGIDNRARVHDVQRQLEQLDAFKKERSLLLKEDREALVGGDYGGIRFYLSEVRIDGKIEGRICIQRVSRRQSDIKLDWLVNHATGIVRHRIKVRQKLSGFGNSQARDQLQGALR